MTDPETVKECDACFAEFVGPGDLCPDCQRGYDQTHDEDGNLLPHETYDPYPGMEV